MNEENRDGITEPIETIGDADEPSSQPLTNAEYQRYGRQLIMPEVGLKGQLCLKSSNVLVIGVGGLGCPAASYLAGAGVGTIGLVDGDFVDISNLHRQIAHTTERIGMSKVESAAQYLRSLNPNVELNLYRDSLTPQTALHVIAKYDIVLDCTDHPTTRYMISDACVLLKKPLVSASALRTEGQLMVLNYPPARPGDPNGGPCYRCIFPKPPPAEFVLSCADGGIMGPVVGVMGVLQALECIKLIAAGAPQSTEASADMQASMLVFSAFNAQQFRTVRLRPRKKNCSSCSVDATISELSLISGSLDYVAFCGVTASVDLIAPEQRLNASEVDMTMSSRPPVIDVREQVQFELCSLNNSVNIPWPEMMEWTTMEDVPKEKAQLLSAERPLVFVCRFGNDSQLAVKKVMDLGIVSNSKDVVDIRGGLRAWRQEVNPSFPDY